MITSCGHQSLSTAVVLTAAENEGGAPTARTVCEECYQRQLPQLMQQALELMPLVNSIPCGFCEAKPSRHCRDLDMGLCDECRKQSQEEERVYAAARVPKCGVLPDLVDEEYQVFIGEKDSAYDVRVLKMLGITDVVVCCSHLALYCRDWERDRSKQGAREELAGRGGVDADDNVTCDEASDGYGLRVRHLRLPMRDSLDQHLLAYLPAACQVLGGYEPVLRQEEEYRRRVQQQEEEYRRRVQQQEEEYRRRVQQQEEEYRRRVQQQEEEYRRRVQQQGKEGKQQERAPCGDDAEGAAAATASHDSSGGADNGTGARDAAPTAQVYRRSGGVLVHCNAGVSRSTATVIGWIMRCRGWGFDDARSFVKSRRKCTYPNDNFVEQLRAMEAEARAAASTGDATACCSAGTD